MIAIEVKAIWKGTAIFISFFTPDSDVYVDEPVKFIARKDERLGINKDQEIIPKIFVPSILVRNRIIETSNPVINPFTAKLRKGMYGRSIGVITIPEKYPSKIFRIIGSPFEIAC